MTLFLTTVFLIYILMHVYAFMKVKAAFALGIRGGFFIVLFMTAMVLAPIFIRLLERYGYEYPARLLSYVGYTWMGLLFLFLCASLVLDVYRFFVHGTGLLLRRDLIPFLPSPRTCFVAPFVLASVLAVYGYFEARDIRVETVTIGTPKIPASVGKLTITQISDVHLGLIVREERLELILEKVKSSNPDIVISTGDLVDGQINDLKGLAELLHEIKPRYGKYAITGNHEFYAGLSQALDFTRRSGFTLLRGQAVTAGDLVNIAGVDDPAGKAFGLYKGVPESDLLSGLPHDKFTLLLKHLPLVDESALGLFDLQISGHTHKGQIFPFVWVTRLFFNHPTGWTDLPEDSHLYVSRGTGTWGPPIRLLAPPEVTVYELVHRE